MNNIRLPSLQLRSAHITVHCDGKVRAMAVKVGDKVLFGKYSGQSVKVDGEELLVMREEYIMAVVE